MRRPVFGAIRAPTHDAGGPSGTNRRSGGFVELGLVIGLLSGKERFYWLSRLSVNSSCCTRPRPLTEGPNYNSFEREAGPLHAIR